MTLGREPAHLALRDTAIALVLTLGMALLPLNGPSTYVVGQLTLFCLWACLAVQWNLVFGFAGIMSLAQVTIFGVGGYAAAMLALYLEISFWLAWVLGGLVAVAVSFVIGLATLRMRGEYVAIVTLAIGVMIYAVVVTDVECYRYVGAVCHNFTGGTRGLLKYGDFGWIEVLGYKDRALGDFYLALALLSVCMIATIVLVHSPFGLAFRALRDNEPLGRTRGLSFRKYQLFVFTLAGFGTGLAGGLYAGFLKTIGPTVLGLDLLLMVLAMMIVGGRGSLWGPLLGTAVLMFLDELMKSSGQWRSSVLAGATILFVLLFPKGLAGMLSSLGSALSALALKRRKSPVAREASP